MRSQPSPGWGLHRSWAEPLLHFRAAAFASASAFRGGGANCSRPVVLTHKLLVILAVASFALGTYCLVVRDYKGILLFLAAAYFSYRSFQHNPVEQAFRHVARGDMASAAILLGKVPRPEHLSSRDRAYFELASGLVKASQAENQRAEQHLTLALEHDLRTENDRALAEAVLSQLLVARDACDEARRIIDRAITRSCRPAIAQRIKKLHEDLSTSGS